MREFNTQHYRAIAFLRHGAIVRSRGQWRFGTTTVGDNVVDDLLYAGRADLLFRGTEAEVVVSRSGR